MSVTKGRMYREVSADGSHVTLQTVAELAGVSPSTVSRILNGTAGVSQSKRVSVESAIQVLGFKPNFVARSLAGGRTLSVGVLTQYIDSPFYGAGIRGIEDVLTAAGYVPIVTSGFWDQTQERQRIQNLIDRRVDGLIILTSRLSDEELIALGQRLPVVVTGRDLEAEHLASLNFENFVAGCIAAEHLFDLGHKDIAVISGPSDHKDSDDRLDGIRASAMDRGLRLSMSSVVVGDYSERGGHRAMKTIIAGGQKFSGIIALNDQMAFGALLALQQAGLRVPEDISIVGMDDVSHSAFTVPPLTTVELPIHETGRRAAEILLKKLSGAPMQTDAQLLRSRLVTRHSTRRISF